MKIKTIIVLITTLLTFSSASAIDRWGKISKGIHYDRLKIEQVTANKCRLTIEIENKSKKFLSSYSFKMIAFDIHKSVEWTKKVKVNSIQSGDDKVVRATIKNCSENNPYKIRFKH